MFPHGVIIIRTFLVPVHKVSKVETVQEQFDVLLPRVITVTQPHLKTSTTVETASFISEPCNDMKDR